MGSPREGGCQCSGRTKHCAFCPSCGTRIHHRVIEAVLKTCSGLLPKWW